MPERRILVAVSGGIAAYKVPELVRALRRGGHPVRCAMTPEATRFVAPLVLQTLCGERVRTQLLDASEEGEIDHIASSSNAWIEAEGINYLPCSLRNRCGVTPENFLNC